MFIEVKLLNGFKKPLLYRVPETWKSIHLLGTVVCVPIRNQVVPALVVQQYNQQPTCTFTIRNVQSCELFPADQHYYSFIKKLGTYYQVDFVHFIKRIRHFLKQKELKNHFPALIRQDVHPDSITLTTEQQRVYSFLLPHLKEPAYTPTVLHGVTGSGKTEIYKQLIIQTIKLKKTALILLPEVTLALQFEKLLREQLPATIPIYGFHSATSIKQKKILWHYLTQEHAMLIIGVHLPILLPIANLGLIIVDEEHDIGYQEKKHPKINSKEAAIWRAYLNNIPILLGSATPSTHSLYNVQAKKWHFFQLKKRFAGSFPTIKTNFLTEHKTRKHFWISKELEHAIHDRLRKKEQVIIFLNRRGFSFFVQCTACSFVFSCTACSVSLTLHKDNFLRCHYCGFSMHLPSACPHCKADEKALLKCGIGTQQIVSILEKLFPAACIARADLDTTSKKTVWQQTLNRFQQGSIDILVGTQTITKGFHFCNVTLVGVIWADLNLHFPVYNAAETTLQQLIQVAGRAGRNHSESTVIVQAMRNHHLFSYLNEINYPAFYRNEIIHRTALGYPPYQKLVELELKNTDEIILHQEAHRIAHILRVNCSQRQYAIHILGPAQPPVYKIKNIHTQRIYLKGPSLHDIIELYKTIKITNYRSHIYFTPNPLTV